MPPAKKKAGKAKVKVKDPKAKNNPKGGVKANVKAGAYKSPGASKFW